MLLDSTTSIGNRLVHKRKRMLSTSLFLSFMEGLILQLDFFELIGLIKMLTGNSLDSLFSVEVAN